MQGLRARRFRCGGMMVAALGAGCLLWLGPSLGAGATFQIGRWHGSALVLGGAESICGPLGPSLEHPRLKHSQNCWRVTSQEKEVGVPAPAASKIIRLPHCSCPTPFARKAPFSNACLPALRF